LPPPLPPDDYAKDVRQSLGVEDDELFILQPTRVVKRKAIEHAIYTFDIEPKGFLAVEIDGYVTEDAVRKAREVLENHELRQKMVETNYEIATRFYSYSVLQQKLKNLIYDTLTCNPKNMKK